MESGVNWVPAGEGGQLTSKATVSEAIKTPKRINKSKILYYYKITSSTMSFSK